ncbi:MAG: hypothetical protein WCC27_11195 [Acidobacteriaceae bacterium]
MASFLRGDFEYDPDGGILDDTHLHFYTYRTADRYLLAESPDLHCDDKGSLGMGAIFRSLPTADRRTPRQCH